MLKKTFFYAMLVLIFGLLGSQSVFGTNGDLKSESEIGQVIARDSVKTKNNAPVVVSQDTLFYIYGDVGVVTARQRAEIVSENITLLTKDFLFTPDSLLVENEDGDLRIVYCEKIIIGITDQQSKSLGKPKEELASNYKAVIIAAVEKEQAKKGWLNILKKVGWAILILAITYFCLKYLNKFFAKIKIFVQGQKDRTIKAIYYIFDADRQLKIALFLVKLIKLIFIAIILYFCLFTFFRIFPETTWLSDTLIGYITSPLKKALKAIIDFIPNLISIIVIVFLFRFIIKAVRVVAEKISDGSMAVKGFYQDWAMPTFHIIKTLLYVFMFIIIFPHLPGSGSPIFQGVSVFMGILFSLGSTSIIGNVVSGLVITYMRPFKIGDRIKMGEFLGNVIEKTPLVTRIRTPKNEVITIPNANVMASQTVNYTNSAKEYGLILHTTITVGYEISWRKVHELLIEAGINIPNVLKDPKPFILQVALDDFYVKYQINVYTREANEMANIYSDLNKNIQDIFNREEIELMSPHYRSQRDGSEVVMPKEYIHSEKFRVSPFHLNVKIDKEDNNNQ